MKKRQKLLMKLYSLASYIHYANNKPGYFQVLPSKDWDNIEIHFKIMNDIFRNDFKQEDFPILDAFLLKIEYYEFASNKEVSLNAFYVMEELERAITN